MGRAQVGLFQRLLASGEKPHPVRKLAPDRIAGGVDSAGEVLEFGPLNHSMHQVDEHIRIADLAPLSRIYEHALERMLGLPRRS